MSFNDTPSDLQLIWDKFIEFEAFRRDSEDDLNLFIEKWKEKMAKVQSAGCQYSELVLGLKLIEKVNLSPDFTVSVISNLGSSTFSSECFLSEVVTNIKELSYISGSSGNPNKAKRNIIRTSEHNRLNNEELDSKQKFLPYPVTFLDDGSDSKHHLRQDVVDQDEVINSKEESRTESVFLKCPTCDKNFLLPENLEKHMINHANAMFDSDDESSFGQAWIDSPEMDAESQKDEAILDVEIKNEVKNEISEVSYVKNGPSKASKSLKESENNGSPKKQPYRNVPFVPCEICGKSFAKNNLKNHMKTHNPSHKCSICQKECEKLWMLNKHMLIHKTTRDYNCSHCDKTYKAKDGLNKHLLKMHTKEKNIPKVQTEEKKTIVTKRKLPCEICGKSIAEDNMSVHVRAHFTEAFKCNICPKKYKKMYMLESHMETHSPSAEAIECSICQKQFKYTALLKKHMETHRTTRDHICSYCGKKYKTKDTLREHLNVHTKTRQLPCQSCEKIFYSHNSLKFHIRAHHTGEKPYKCDHCEKRFYTSTKKMEHVRFHTGEKPFPCHVCGKYFRDYGTRRKHIKNLHKEVKPCDA